MEDKLLVNLISEFQSIFEHKAERMFFAPGRVNLIGEHTDYNGGYVFPCTISNGTYGVMSQRNDQEVHVYSLNFPDKGMISFNLDQLAYQATHDWANYVKGMLLYLQEMCEPLSNGMNLLIYGNIPNGAGLSSSSSLEMLIGEMVNVVYQLGIDKVSLIKMGQKVENQYLGVNTGIMDQFAIAMGQEDKAIYLNTNTLDYELIPAEFGKHKLLIMNTNKRRELADSKYNERRQQCEEALRRLQSELEIETLCDLDEELFEAHRHLINDSILEARAKHAIYENQRAKLACDKLKHHDIEGFGQLMNASHESLRLDYDVTGKELDCLVHNAWNIPSVKGARMTGAGMGGCAIALVEENSLEEVIKQIQRHYREEIGYDASFYVASIGPGTKELLYDSI